MDTTICIAAYNQANFLSEAVLSCASQTTQPFVISISDDASTDETQAVCQSLLNALHIPLKYHRNSNNLGITGNVDQLFRAANTQFILRLDSDDLLEPTAIQVLSDALRANSSAGCAHGMVWQIAADGTRQFCRKLARRPGVEAADDALLAAMKGYKVAANIVMFRRKALESVQFMSGRPSFGEDYHLFVDLARHGWANVYVPTIVGSYRSYSTPSRSARKIAELQGIRQIFDELLNPSTLHGLALESEILQARSRMSAAHARCLVNMTHDKAQLLHIVEALDALAPTRISKLYRFAKSAGLSSPLSWALKTRDRLRSVAKDIYLKITLAGR